MEWTKAYVAAVIVIPALEDLDRYYGNVGKYSLAKQLREALEVLREEILKKGRCQCPK